MTLEKVKEIQDYLAEYGIVISEVAIVNAAIDIAKRLGADKWTFVCEFVGDPNILPALEAEKKRGEEKQGGKRWMHQ